MVASVKMRSVCTFVLKCFPVCIVCSCITTSVFLPFLCCFFIHSYCLIFYFACLPIKSHLCWYSDITPLPVLAWSEAQVSGRTFAGIAGSITTGDMDVNLLWILCVVGWGFCRSLVQRSHTECNMSECGLETPTMRRPRPNGAVEQLERSDITPWNTVCGSGRSVTTTLPRRAPGRSLRRYRRSWCTVGLLHVYSNWTLHILALSHGVWLHFSNFVIRESVWVR
jgi:hypothetical protein